MKSVGAIMTKPFETRMPEDKLFEILDETHHDLVRTWLERNVGIAVYQNQALDSANHGHRKFVSFGSFLAQLETNKPPMRLPDIGGTINWAYQLEAVVHRWADMGGADTAIWTEPQL